MNKFLKVIIIVALLLFLVNIMSQLGHALIFSFKYESVKDECIIKKVDCATPSTNMFIESSSKSGVAACNVVWLVNKTGNIVEKKYHFNFQRFMFHFLLSQEQKLKNNEIVNYYTNTKGCFDEVQDFIFKKNIDQDLSVKCVYNKFNENDVTFLET